MGIHDDGSDERFHLGPWETKLTPSARNELHQWMAAQLQPVNDQSNRKKALSLALSIAQENHKTADHIERAQAFLTFLNGEGAK